MKKNEHHIFETLKKITLSREERALLETRLAEHRAFAPLPEDAPEEKQALSSFPLFFRRVRFAPALAAFLIAAVAGGGTALAAERALPGDPLYGFKTELNERARLALTLSAEARAEGNAWRAERRLEEARALAERGRLTEERKERLEENFSEHAARAGARVALIAEDDPALASELATKFEASLSAHEAILAARGTDPEGRVRVSLRSAIALFAKERRLATARILEKPGAEERSGGAVQMFSVEVAPDENGTEIHIKSATLSAPTLQDDAAERDALPALEEDTGAQKEAAERLRESASDALLKTKREYARRAERLSAERRARVEAEIMRVDAYFNLAETHRASGEYRRAFIEFQSILSAMNSLAVLVKNAATEEGGIESPFILDIDITKPVPALPPEGVPAATTGDEGEAGTGESGDETPPVPLRRDI